MDAWDSEHSDLHLVPVTFQTVIYFHHMVLRKKEILYMHTYFISLSCHFGAQWISSMKGEKDKLYIETIPDN
jgi:hypothetical protein